jgi:hypothetical protein
MTVTAENIVSREVHYCVSALVSELAKGYGGTNEELGDIAEAAFNLACPIDDYEEAAIQEGWKRMGDIAVHKTHGAYDLSAASDWRDLCEEHDIEPYQREVFEHWIVSDWLADKLAEKGEKVDKDFAGLTVWARTTTGQGIASDSVIEAIVADLNAAV